MSTSTKQKQESIAGTFTCPRDRADVGRTICDQLDGVSSVNPDGSLTCKFVLAEPLSGADRVKGSFSVKRDAVVHGAEICQQLGGTFSESKSGAKCDFYLPQEPRWSACPISDRSGTIRFDSETFYVVAATPTGAVLKLFQNGTEMERCTLTFFADGTGARLDAKGADGVPSSLEFSSEHGIAAIRYSYGGQTVIDVKTPLEEAEKTFAAHYARNPDCHARLPYSHLLVNEMSANRPFHEQVLGLIGSQIQPPMPLGVVSFCFFACRACLISLEPHACVAWAFCMGFQPNWITAATPGGPQ